ncbi:MAG: TlpA disulfide reductase family protein [Myxococcota bacterium]
MKRLTDWLVALVVAALIASVIGDMGQGPNLPDEAPTFSLTMLDGQPIDLETLRGQTVVVNFWASWCGPCRQEIPEFSAFAQDHPDIMVLGLAVDSGDTSEVRRSARRLGIDYPVAIASRSLVRAYDVSAFPTTVIVDPDGQVAHVQVGAMSYQQLSQATGVDL